MLGLVGRPVSLRKCQSGQSLPDQSGFTLIELMIVIAIISLLIVVSLPPVFGGGVANSMADNRNLGRQYEWLIAYKRKHGGVLPTNGGHKFVMAAWVSGVVEQTPENWDRFWTPGPERDLDRTYQERRAALLAGQKVLTSLDQVSSLDTSYVGRAREHLDTAEESAEEAWMADDNEHGWNLREGSVNVLMADGNVRTYSYQQMKDQFGLGKFDFDDPVQTFGPKSPIVPCRKLDN